MFNSELALSYEKRIAELNCRDTVPLFETVYFEVRSKCNGRCEFCMASVKTDFRKDVSMTFELYNSVIKQLKELEFSGRLAYHVNNEPLLFNNLVMFVSHARENLPKAHIQILTNGLLLTLSKAEALLKAGVTELIINYYSYKRKPELAKVFNEIKAKIAPFNLVINYRNEEDVLNSRGGTSPNRRCSVKELKGYFCEYPFTQFNINPKGLVSKCCADVLFTDIMGDVTKSSIIDIWRGKALTYARKELLEGNRYLLPLCNKCDFIGVRHLYKGEKQ